MSAGSAVLTGVPGFFAPRWSPLNLIAAGSARDVSFYDTTQLQGTLKRLIDFEQINDGPMRLSMGAVQVTTGNLAYFDNRKQRVGPEHVMASGALPPGFPAVEVDGELSGTGAFTPTPPWTSCWTMRRAMTRCALWLTYGIRKAAIPAHWPRSLSRHKDLTYSSRSLQHIESYRAIHDLRNAVRVLRDLLPEDSRNDPAISALADMGCTTTMHIVHLVYPGQDWELGYKDVDFSWSRTQERWRHGYRDAVRALTDAAWLKPVPSEIGVVVHELAETE